jgi:hypothetical protein
LGKINEKSFIIGNVLPLIISLGESDSEFDAGNDDSEFSNEIMEVE